ncbi:hypothetical protein X907_1944 [Glycocaulis alkaliphilus]|uniref:Uncharacterized protein n=1 Tax=Glycocaulis alkaliphilus TaxID=1434191 RepID=A0A3T0EB87_9PROT|nr:hypothetical protein [Glycocaulis alkaliphilus]AZU04467.1 hypothetical protein X907_1944 [Glycocaulis alkaliphilus]
MKVLREPPPALRKLMAGFHQDFLLEAEQAGGVEAAIAGMPAGLLGADERESLKPLLRKLLNEASPSDLKGLIHRSGADHVFKAAGARRLFELWADALGA